MNREETKICPLMSGGIVAPAQSAGVDDNGRVYTGQKQAQPMLFSVPCIAEKCMLWSDLYTCCTLAIIDKPVELKGPGANCDN